MTTVAQVKQAAIDHAPIPVEDISTESAPKASVEDGSDPTATHAGLTELQQSETNGTTVEEHGTSHAQAEGNVAGERWDTTTGAEKEGLEDSYEIIPRPNDEVDIPATAPTEAAPQQTSSWADEPAAGNLAGESWDTKAAGQEAATDAPTNGVADDGFHEVPGRARGGRGGFRSGRGEGEPRGGRGGRGGRGRGGPHRGGRGDGEGRGRGGRGRGPRGDGSAPARS